ncbi:MAG: DUF2207 domain-containing protein [Firmicutes bacterium]|nr:DUF2207 domain-containing protein [Bacillota bacterium]
MINNSGCNMKKILFFICLFFSCLCIVNADVINVYNVKNATINTINLLHIDEENEGLISRKYKFNAPDSSDLKQMDSKDFDIFDIIIIIMRLIIIIGIVYVLKFLISIPIIVLGFISLAIILSGNFILIYLYIVCIGILFLATRPMRFNNGKKINKKNTPFYRGIPCNGDIYYANTLLRLNKINFKKSNIIGAIFLKWMKDDIVTFTTNEENKKVFILKQNPNIDNNTERRLYRKIYEASRNGVLEKWEFNLWVKKNYHEFSSIQGNITYEYQWKLEKENHIMKKYKITKVMDDMMYEDTKKLYGLRLFLVEFSSMKIREPIEVDLWKEYLVFACLFGLSKEVMKKFDDLYPEITEFTELFQPTLLIKR